MQSAAGSDADQMKLFKGNSRSSTGVQHLMSWDYQASRCSKASFIGIKAFPYISPSIAERFL